LNRRRAHGIIHVAARLMADLGVGLGQQIDLILVDVDTVR
jgi:hypothetical protein